MDLLREILRWAHVILGFTGLIAFWFPVFSRKGGYVHRRAGKVFVVCGYGVTASAMASCAVLVWLIVGRGLTAQNLAGLASIAMLAYLGLVTFVILRHSIKVLEAKPDPMQLDTWFNRGLAGAAIAASLLIVALAVIQPTSNSVLLIVMSPIGLGSGVGILRYITGKDTSRRAWFYAHLRSTLGAGIGFHTAFAVFGASRLFDLQVTGLAGVLPWILPAAVGVPATFLWQRHYRRKLGDTTPMGEAVPATEHA